MRNKVKIRHFKKSDLKDLFADLREADRIEVEAMTGKNYKEAIIDGTKISLILKTGIYDGQVVCIWGMAKPVMMGRVGVPWMVATNKIEEVPLTFLRRCKKYLKELSITCATLENYVDSRNDVTIQWLKWLGFKIGKPEPVGVNGEMFYRFSMEVKNV